jgi:Protein of unknown function (DUF3352)
VSDQQPPASGPGEPEYLGSPVDTDRDATRTGPRWGLVGGAAVAVVATVAAGGWGLAQLMAAPGSPADAVPANALAYLSLDLDPSASQKIAAIRTLQKFPALKEELDLDARDDVRRWAFEAVLADSGCESVTYADDVEPWIGNRMAVAAVPDQGATVAPLFVVQVGDQDAATAGLTALADCADEKLGVAFVDDYAVLMEKQADADSYATAAEASPLAEDPDFGTWTDRAGDPGIVTAYVAADAPARMSDLAGVEAFGQDAAELYRDFEGAAGVIRFQDGRIEAELVTKGMPGGVAPVGEPGAPSLAELPDSTAAAFTMSFRDGWLEDWVGSLGDLFGGAAAGGPGGGDLWQDLEGQTGLQLPEDIETLLGDGLRVSVDGSVDVADLDGSDVPQAPVGIRINGDETEIVRVLDRLRALMPAGSDDVLLQRTGQGYVVLGLDPAYLDQLTAPGGLGDDDTFAAVMPEADRVSGGVYVNFDAEDWATRLAQQLGNGDPEVAANVAPLDALGLSSWLDDEDVQHGLFRLSTD